MKLISRPYVRQMAKELGIFVAICSRNDSGEVAKAIEKIDAQVFPIKTQIDCVVANNNDKSENIRAIAKQLHILPSSIVFIDDNEIERDKIRKTLSDVLVIDWRNHCDLTTQIIACCIFDRFELSLNSQGRREQFKIINEEKRQNTLPKLYLKICFDKEHIEAQKLYLKSNQFKFISGENSKSLFFDYYGEYADAGLILERFKPAVYPVLSNKSTSIYFQYLVNFRVNR